MNYIDEIFLRANIQKLRGFLLYGADCKIDPRPYLERLDAADDRMAERLHQELPDSELCEDVLSTVYNYSGSMGDVYMEIGLQAGVLFAAQLCQNLMAILEQADGLEA